MIKPRKLIVVLLSAVLLLVAAKPSAISQPGPEIQISTPSSSPIEADRYSPAVAYNSTRDEFLVVWSNAWPGNSDLYAQRISGDGTKVGPWFCVSTGSGHLSNPAVAYSSTSQQYLVVWKYDADGKHTEIWGRTVAWNGSAMGAPHQIFAWANRAFWAPSVAWNSRHNEYMVVANAWDTITNKANDVVRRRVLPPDGSMPYPGSFVIQSQTLMPQEGDITYNVTADRYLVVWKQLWSGSDWDIHGAFLNWDGTLYGSTFPIDADRADQRTPSVATNGQGRYLVAFAQLSSHPCCSLDVRAQELDAAGTPLGNSYAIASSIVNEVNFRALARPGKGRDYLVVWQRSTSVEQTIWAVRWADPEVAPSASSQWLPVADYPGWWSERPAAALGQSGYLIAHDRDSATNTSIYRHIYGRMLFFGRAFLPQIIR